MVDASLSIHCYDSDTASVFVETTTSGEEEQRAEMLLFCLYAAHWLDELNRSHRSRGINPGVDLALVLRVSEREELLMDPLVWFFDDEQPLVQLVSGKEPARKGFSAQLRYIDSEKPSSINFAVKASGFGLLGRGLRGVGESAVQSVLALQRHLLMQREHDHPYTIRFWWACHTLGDIALKRGVLPTETAVEAVALGWQAVDRVGTARSETQP